MTIKRKVFRWKSLLALVVLATLPIACSGGSSSSESDDDSLSAVPPGNSEPENGGELDSGSTLALSSGTQATDVFYQQEDSSADQCAFIHPFVLDVSGTTASFQERTDTASTYTISGGGFWAEIEDTQTYTCFFGLLDANTTASVSCYDPSGGRCTALFTVDSAGTYQLPATVFKTESSTTCPDFPSQTVVSVTGNRASLTLGDGSAASYVLTGPEEFNFDYGSTTTDNAHGSVVDKSFVGYVYNYNDQIGQSCSFATATTSTVTAPPPDENPGGGGSTPTNCGGSLSTWYGPCLKPGRN